MATDELLSQKHVSAAIGCILGHAIGGSFGARYQFQSTLNTLKMIEEDFDPQSRLIPLLGGGKYELEPGGLTSETLMALYLSNNICQNNREYTSESVAKSYIDWLNTNPPEVGNATKSALTISPAINRSLSTFSFSKNVAQNALSNNSTVLSNASMARLFPLAILGSTLTEEEFLSLVESDTRLTHPHNLVIDACRVYTNCIRTALITRDRNQILNTARRTPKTKAILQIVQTALERESPFIFFSSEISQPECIECDGQRMVYFGIALHCMIFEVAHGRSFERSIERVVMKGGDTDTNAAITGSVLGALYGENAIPVEWKNSLFRNPQGKKLVENVSEIANILIGNSPTLQKN